MKSSQQKKSDPTGKSPAPVLSGRNGVLWVIIFFGIIVLATLKGRMKSPSTAESPSPAVSTNASATIAQAKPDFQKLKGRWLRPDGGYVIEIKSADEHGKLEAGYFNPKSIRVAKAEATQEGSATKVFIELQDVNYPGSTYTLVYVPDRDLLAGVYYQALQRQSFDVYFERMK